MKRLFPNRKPGRKPRIIKPLLTKRDPAYAGQKHLKAIQNPEGWYKP